MPDSRKLKIKKAGTTFLESTKVPYPLLVTPLKLPGTSRGPCRSVVCQVTSGCGTGPGYLRGTGERVLPTVDVVPGTPVWYMAPSSSRTLPGIPSVACPAYPAVCSGHGVPGGVPRPSALALALALSPRVLSV